MASAAQGQASGGVQSTIQYRYRVGATVSAWMTADQLRDSALRGDLTPEGEVQQSGHTEWVVATHVRGLTFPAPEPVPGHTEGTTPSGIMSNGNARVPRFATFRDLLGLYVNADIEVNLPDASEYSPAKLYAAGTDHFEVTLEGGRSRVFLPYARIQAIWVTETSTNMTLTYREAHRITIELQPTKR
jgi:hypothetical protein